MEKIIQTLKNEGIDASQVVIPKNGIPCMGIRVKIAGSRICPIVYYNKEETERDVLNRVHIVLQNEMPMIDTDRLTDRHYILNNLFLAVSRHCSEADYLSKPYLNFDLYMIVKVQDNEEKTSVIKVNSKYVNTLGLKESLLWERAAENTCKIATIRSMTDVLGLDSDLTEDMLYVGTTNLPGGAGILAIPEVFRDFCAKAGETECYILPSSTDEVILIRGSYTRNMMTPEELVRMVDQINHEIVDPVQQLEPAVYMFHMDTGVVEIACLPEEVPIYG